MKTVQKILALLLCCLMAFGGVCVTADAGNRVFL